MPIIVHFSSRGAWHCQLSSVFTSKNEFFFQLIEKIAESRTETERANPKALFGPKGGKVLHPIHRQ